MSNKTFFATFAAREGWLTDYATRQLKKHGLKDWKFEIASFYDEERIAEAGRPALVGYCSSPTKVITVFPSTLRYSKTVLRHTVLHEIAHALAPNDHEHGAAWLEQCSRIMALSMYLQERSIYGPGVSKNRNWHPAIAGAALAGGSNA